MRFRLVDGLVEPEVPWDEWPAVVPVTREMIRAWVDTANEMERLTRRTEAAAAALAKVETMTTYERADGGLIAGEFRFVTETEWFDDVDDPEVTIRKLWIVDESHEVTFWPRLGVPCEACGSEGETPSGAACPRCLGDGFVHRGDEPQVRPLPKGDSDG